MIHIFIRKLLFIKFIYQLKIDIMTYKLISCYCTKGFLQIILSLEMGRSSILLK